MCSLREHSVWGSRGSQPTRCFRQPRGPRSFSLGSCTSKWEGLHGNCLIIFWGCFLRVRSQGCLQKAEGQSHAFIHCPMLGHSSTARSQRGKREREDTELPLQEALLCELSFYLGADVCVLDKIPLCKPRLSLEPEFLLPQPPSSGWKHARLLFSLG